MKTLIERIAEKLGADEIDVKNFRLSHAARYDRDGNMTKSKADTWDEKKAEFYFKEYLAGRKQAEMGARL